MKKTPFEIKTIHFTGIGGIGMSGIAEILISQGYKVQGSDLSENANVERLRNKGTRILIGHATENIKCENGDNVSAVVISSAVKQDNPEVVAARQAGIPVVKRADMLSELMRHKWAIAIGGTHGKTTTTSMVGAMLETGNLDPTVVNGGIVNAYGTNVRLGNSDWLVAEADESDGSFTRLPATIATVTNIDPEHMEHYGNFANMQAAYRTFVNNLPFFGFAVLCTDHPEVQSLIPHLTDRRIITYGFNPQADIRAINIRQTSNGSEFDVICGKETIHDIYLPMLGRHNVQNSLVSIAIARELSIPTSLIKKALSEFKGVKRRFTKTGEVNGISIIDDYGHHPVEIAAVLKAARQAVENTNGNIIAVMQPHRYTRLHDLFEEFSTCFNDADSVIIADIYPAGEKPIEGISKEHLAQSVKTHGHKDVHILENPQKLASVIANIAKKGDYVICLGAGNITTWANNLPDELELTINKKTGT